jgi:putative polymerase
MSVPAPQYARSPPRNTIPPASHTARADTQAEKDTAHFTKVSTSLVVAASAFNLVLCFIETRHWATPGNTGIIAIELFILACGLFFIRHHLSRGAVQMASVILLYLLGVKLINPGLDLKIYHDLAIMYIFFILGTQSSTEIANRILWIVMAIVLSVGLFEWLLPVQFGNTFDVWSYYVDKGTLGHDVINYSQSNLFLSSNRGNATARTFLPSLLGTHRVSSIFLEPVSMGNFATIVFAWCLSTTEKQRWNHALLFLLAAVCIVLGDSRFGSACCAIMLLLRFVPATQSKFVVFLMPVFLMLALMFAGEIHEVPGVVPAIQSDNFPGRLLFSGRLLDYWHLSQWLGFAQSPVYTSDTGYAYFISNLGLPLSLIVLWVFAAYEPKRKEAAIMKAMIAIYYATSLGVGSSVFSIKTGALLWFLYGATNAVQVRRAPPARKETSSIPVSSIFPLSQEGQAP